MSSSIHVAQHEKNIKIKYPRVSLSLTISEINLCEDAFALKAHHNIPHSPLFDCSGKYIPAVVTFCDEISNLLITIKTNQKLSSLNLIYVSITIYVFSQVNLYGHADLK